MVPIHQVVRLLMAVQEKSRNHQSILRGSRKYAEIVMLVNTPSNASAHLKFTVK